MGDLPMVTAPDLISLDEARAWLAELPFRWVRTELSYDAEGERDERGKPPDPHQYVILGWRGVEQPEFGRFVELIRARGYRARYSPPYAPERVMVNHYLELDGWIYWFIAPDMLNRQRAASPQHTRLARVEEMES
jgi:hypothetical protein